MENENARTRAVRKALEAVPTSLRKLGRAAGVSHSSLAKIKRGDLGASEDVARRVAGVLERWSESLEGAAGKIRHAMNDGEEGIR